ncbi:DUF4919 domain-containing protein [Nocardioides sp. InS609-2]|uniref:DUF4919 domain-containing protein n=1 Tax=Nocardioides sp. InS609-2 TaxID=2760705 RepID=UPI0020C16814|nr:DUF4919 domain-containing protein [Nocardioides sp. InS609-2]
MTSGTNEPNGLAELAASYAEGRGAGDLARLRDLIRRSPDFDPGLNVVEVVSPLFARGAQAEVVAAVEALMPGAFFSPSAHAALGAAHAALGDATRARHERRTQVLALDSIRSTGDGTREQPWSVLRISDEYDLLRAGGRVSREQTLVAIEGRSFDHHVCTDGSEAWFDASHLVSA